MVIASQVKEASRTLLASRCPGLTGSAYEDCQRNAAIARCAAAGAEHDFVNQVSSVSIILKAFRCSPGRILSIIIIII